jgi:cation/acetate symporter
VYQNVLGSSVASIGDVEALLAGNSWIRSFGDLGRVSICGATGDALNGVALTAQMIFDACQAAGVNELNHTAFAIQTDVVVIATPEIAGLPYVIAGLVAAGGLAAALSTADGLLLAIANALSHDIYYRMIDPHATTRRRLVVARVLLIVVAVLGATAVAFLSLGNILALVSYAFSLAAAGLFPALVMGVWWRRTTAAGAIWGMISGFAVTVAYLVYTHPGIGFGAEPIFGISNISCGIFGLPVGFLVTWLVSLATPAPSQEMQDFIQALRIPRGEALMDRGAEAAH